MKIYFDIISKGKELLGITSYTTYLNKKGLRWSVNISQSNSKHYGGVQISNYDHPPPAIRLRCVTGLWNVHPSSMSLKFQSYTFFGYFHSNFIIFQKLFNTGFIDWEMCTIANIKFLSAFTENLDPRFFFYFSFKLLTVPSCFFFPL